MPTNQEILKSIQDVLADYETIANLVKNFGYDIFTDEVAFALAALEAMGAENE